MSYNNKEELAVTKGTNAQYNNHSNVILLILLILLIDIHNNIKYEIELYENIFLKTTYLKYIINGC